MKLLRTISTMAAVLVAGVTFSTSLSAPASAQGFFEALFGNFRDGRKIIDFPGREAPGTIVVSFADRRLYWVLKGRQAISYPIGVPTGDARWSGVTHVSSKRVNPSWTPTADMRRQNPRLPAFVPGGHPLNPLGPRAMYLGNTMYRIHGTDAPWTIGQEVSHGCIRMLNADAVDVYNRTPIGTRVVVTWKRYS